MTPNIQLSKHLNKISEHCITCPKVGTTAGLLALNQVQDFGQFNFASLIQVNQKPVSLLCNETPQKRVLLKNLVY